MPTSLLTGLVIFAIFLLIVLLTLWVVLYLQGKKADLGPILLRLESLSAALDRGEKSAREDAALQRQEASAQAHQLREELQNAMRLTSKAQGENLDRISHLQQQRLGDFSTRLEAMQQAHEKAAATLRQELTTALKNFQETLQTQLSESSRQMQQHFATFSQSLTALTETSGKKSEELRTAVENRLHLLQQDNAAKLEEMRRTVDEKLQGTLEKRLGESFRLVSERLEQVHQGLGDMKNLASGVGDLTRMLTNVKTRGGWGEMQLANLLQQILAPEQYATNVRPDPDSREVVEFAIKLPGRQDGDRPVWLPIDAKFPREDYERLVEAAEKADANAVEAAAKALELKLRAQARDIRDKYLKPPHTTDFGLLYLPIEGLYAEALRRPGLADNLQRDYRIVLAGPTTLAALLNSLQIGFRSLAIQKRSSEVWKILGSVKTEFGKFGDILEKVKIKLNETTDTLDKAVHRSRQIEKKLRKVEDLPENQTRSALADGTPPVREVQKEDLFSDGAASSQG